MLLYRGFLMKVQVVKNKNIKHQGNPLRLTGGKVTVVRGSTSFSLLRIIWSLITASYPSHTWICKIGSIILRNDSHLRGVTNRIRIVMSYGVPESLI